MLVYYSDVFKKHVPPFRHPEAPDRLDYLVEGVLEAGAVVKEPEMRADVWDLIYAVHDKGYVDYVKRMCERGGAEIDGDTYVSPGTCDAAALSVSAVVNAIDRREVALVASRPPGHHAGFVGRALTAPTQGFCIFNTAAIGALYLGEGAAVVDIDVHHGNGTQEILYAKDLLYISTHQHPATLYPGTGYPEEVGEGRGEGFNINIPLPPGTGDDIYVKVVDEFIIPILRQYNPRLVIVSLGWDAHRDDPLADLNLSLKGYLYAIDAILKLQKPTVFLLEGGYNRSVIKRGTKALIRLATAGEFAPGEAQTESAPGVYKRFEELAIEVRRHAGRYWRL
ncbi:MAG: histone deacetylase family protein [Pyrobaculum sp.]